jgi:hypothetical protein
VLPQGADLRSGDAAQLGGADADLHVLGQQLAARKGEVMDEAEDGEEESARSRRPGADSGERGVLARALRRVWDE